MSIFTENLTSKLLQQNSIKILNLKKDNNVLELGCGNGNITKYLIDHQKYDNNFFCSDISLEAIEIVKKNINYPKLVARSGSMFEPWKSDNLKYDVIISDVSSISEPIAEKSPWYSGVISDCGLDGLKNVKIILKDLKKFLKNDGYFILPIISLCNLNILNELLKNNFINISYSEQINWPIPEFFKNNINNFQNLIDTNQISVEYKFGAYLAFTCVAICSN